MTDRKNDKQKPESREDRLRAALRANLQRRKAQARARADLAERDDSNDTDTGGEE
jgi:hypothetical protein